MDEATYRRTAARLGAPEGSDTWNRLQMLAGLWRRYAGVINLTGAVDWPGLRSQIVEGLVAARCAEMTQVPGIWLDLGAGGGFPGLVVAATGRSVWLVEPRDKRAAFLELALGALGTEGHVSRHVVESETWREKLLGGVGARKKTPIGVASARAVWSAHAWAALGAEIVGPSGIFLIHARPDSDQETRWEQLARVDEAGWSVRAYRGGTPLHGGNR